MNTSIQPNQSKSFLRKGYKSVPPPIEKSDSLHLHEQVDHNELHDNPSRIICIAVDESDSSQYSFKWALENFICKETDQVFLLHVRPYVSVPTYLSPVPMLEDKETEYELDQCNRNFSHELIRDFAKDLLNENIKCRGFALRGDPREEIVHKVNELNADVLIIGSRGMSTFKRMFIGSVSDYCVHHCHCTVIVPKE
ncbi:hypothetical protein HK099_002487 [Clydaea vesicula]|uniref:UspA domain-containing protein n=1 Tax=Clydaea vesicula TaxID=447962 RepID=A0AAD5TV99_9FUNG|nr:hypothetical protein HK099_002487 [Clydaea vesicula]KAJ3387400.1 hypothetical protein HDU92_001978 [Lobulomyces angularis]